MTQDAKPAGMPDDDDAAALRERVQALEQTVQEQQSTIEQLMPSRRAILAGGAGLVGGAALTSQASAQSAAGQVGTSSEPVDVEATTVNATDVNTDSVNTDNLRSFGVGRFGKSFSSVADDSVVTYNLKDDIQPNTNSPYILTVFAGGTTPRASAVFATAFNSLSSGPLETVTNQGTANLTGSTGPDGSLNVSRDKDTLQLENRLGGTKDIAVIQEGLL
jgi:hypothetical protein